MAKTLSKLLKSQVGNGGKKYWKYAGFASRVEWCGAFVWWCLHHCSEKYEYMKASQNPFYVPNVEAWAKKHGRNIKKSKAKRGDVITFDWNGNGSGDHIGFFWSGDPTGTFTTIEGNTGGGAGRVMMRTRYASQLNMVIRLKKEKTAPTVEEKPKATTTTKKAKKAVSTPISATYKVLPSTGMNVRKEPKVKSDRVGGIPYGVKFHASRKNGNWVYAPDYKGWVCLGSEKEKYLKKVN